MNTAAKSQRLLFLPLRQRETTTGLIQNTHFRQIYSIHWNLLRGKGRNKNIFTLAHIRGIRMHMKLERITRFILLCICIGANQLKWNLKKREADGEFTQKALFVDTPPPPSARGKWNIRVCAGMAEQRWKSVWLRSLRSPPPAFDPVY